MKTDGWPTPLRFSRRLGEAYPDAAYACALEGPRPGRAYELLNLALSSIRARVAHAFDGKMHRWTMLASEE